LWWYTDLGIFRSLEFWYSCFDDGRLLMDSSGFGLCAVLVIWFVGMRFGVSISVMLYLRDRCWYLGCSGQLWVWWCFDLGDLVSVRVVFNYWKFSGIWRLDIGMIVDLLSFGSCSVFWEYWVMVTILIVSNFWEDLSWVWD
jgi:hypothetical protein